MSRWSWLPAGAQVTDVMPDRWHVRLPGGLPMFDVTLDRGNGAGGDHNWLVLAAGLPRAGEHQHGPTPAYLEQLMDLQDRFPGVKVVLPTAHGRSTLSLPAQLRVEMPLTAGGGDVVDDDWARPVFNRFVAALSDASSVEAVVDAPAHTVGEHVLSEALADLDYVLTPAEDNGIRVDVPIADVIRPLRLSIERGWLRAEVLLGGGAVRTLEEPMRTALRAYLLRVSGCVKLARAAARTSSNPCGCSLSFVVDLPVAADSRQIDHAIRALATATSTFETEIEHLASEAILAHAYLTTTGISRNGRASSAAINTEL